MTIYDLIYSDGNDRNYFGKMEANDIEQALGVFKEYYFVPEYQKDVTTEISDDECGFLIWLDPMEDQETTEDLDDYPANYIEIIKSKDQETREFKTVFGENNFYYLKNGKLGKDLDLYTILEEYKKINKELKI